MSHSMSKCPDCEALRKELAEAKRCRDNAEAALEAANAERDKWMEYATGDRAELALKMEAANAGIAELEQRCGDETIRSMRELNLRKELAEAKAALTRTQDASLWWDQYNLEVRKHTDTKAALEASIVALRKELAICQEANASWHESYCKRHNDSIEAWKRAQRAEAALKEQLQWKKSYTERAERAEGECKAMRAEIVDECYKIALEQRCVRGTPWDLACLTIADAIKARAALNPSPAETR